MVPLGLGLVVEDRPTELSCTYTVYLGQLNLVQYFLTIDLHAGVQAQFERLGRTLESLLVVLATNPSLHGHRTEVHT